MIILSINIHQLKLALVLNLGWDIQVDEADWMPTAVPRSGPSTVPEHIHGSNWTTSVEQCRSEGKSDKDARFRHTSL